MRAKVSEGPIESIFYYDDGSNGFLLNIGTNHATWCEVVENVYETKTEWANIG